MPDEQAKSNQPKVLVELDPEDIKWLADRLHEEAGRAMQAELLISSKRLDNAQRKLSKKDQAKVDTIAKHKSTAYRLKNLFLDKAADQGFGDL